MSVAHCRHSPCRCETTGILQDGCSLSNQLKKGSRFMSDAAHDAITRNEDAEGDAWRASVADLNRGRDAAMVAKDEGAAWEVSVSDMNRRRNEEQPDLLSGRDENAAWMASVADMNRSRQI